MKSDSLIALKIKPEVDRIRKIAQRLNLIHETICPYVKPGVSTQTLARYCQNLMDKSAIESASEGLDGFPAKVCISVNHVAAHGLPGPDLLVSDDILTIDIAGKKSGWHADAAWTYLVGKGSPMQRRLIKAAWMSSIAGIKAAVTGNRLGDVGHAIENTARRYGCNIVRQCVGHGIGVKLHEDPVILPYGEPDTDRIIVPGMVFTVEPVVTLGNGEVDIEPAGFPITSRDYALCAQFEHTIAVFKDTTEILTQLPGRYYKALDFPPFF